MTGDKGRTIRKATGKRSSHLSDVLGMRPEARHLHNTFDPIS
jgi:hypothetical protein